MQKYANESDPDSARFMEDPEVKKRLERAKRLTDIQVEDYDAVFYPDGHGPVIDLAVDPANKELCSQVSPACFKTTMALMMLYPCQFWNQGKVVSAVCHGVS